MREIFVFKISRENRSLIRKIVVRTPVRVKPIWIKAAVAKSVLRAGPENIGLSEYFKWVPVYNEDAVISFSALVEKSWRDFLPKKQI